VVACISRPAPFWVPMANLGSPRAPIGAKVADKEEKGLLDRLADLVGKREDPEDKSTRVGKGGKSRRRKIDDVVEEAVTGRQREGQTTDSSQ
jgi:hypothetical protein